MLKFTCPFENCPRSYQSSQDLDQHIEEIHVERDEVVQPKSPIFTEKASDQIIPEENEDSENLSSSEDSTPTPVPSFHNSRTISSIIPRIEPTTDQPLTNEMILETAHAHNLSTVTDVPLTQLSLRAMRLNSIDCGPSLHLSALTQLQSLCLAQNKLSDIQSISEVGELRELDLSFNYIIKLRYHPHSPLKKLTKLKKLWCQHNFVSTVKPLKACVELRVLGLANNNIVHLSETVSFLQHLPQLIELDLLENPCMKDTRKSLFYAKDALHLVRLNGMSTEFLSELNAEENSSKPSASPLLAPKSPQTSVRIYSTLLSQLKAELRTEIEHALES